MAVIIKSTRPNAKLIGLTGADGSGKGKFADHMVKEFGYVKLGFADKVCELALKLNPIIWKLPFPQRLKAIVDKKGWTKAKRIPGVRRYLQWLGSDVGRVVFGEDIWISTLKPTLAELLRKGTSVVITNVRFENEAQFIESLGGSIVLISRPGVGPVNDHKSDAGEAFKHAVFTVTNDGTQRDLKDWARACQAAVHGIHANPIANATPFQAAIHRAIAAGVDLVLNTAAPTSCEAMKWRERHRLELEPIEKEVRVLVDGEVAGRVRYCDNIIEIDAKIAR